jgi:hypothetical protein
MLIYQIHIELTAGVTCQQRMLTPPRYLTPYTSIICRSPCKPDFYWWIVPFTWSTYWFGLHILRLLDWTHRFWLWVVPFPWSKHTDFNYGNLRFKWGTRRVWPVDRGCLLLDTWSHLWFLQGSVFAQFSGFVFHTGFMRLRSLFVILLFHSDGEKITVWCQRRRYT